MSRNRRNNNSKGSNGGNSSSGPDTSYIRRLGTTPIPFDGPFSEEHKSAITAMLYSRHGMAAIGLNAGETKFYYNHMDLLRKSTESRRRSGVITRSSSSSSGSDSEEANAVAEELAMKQTLRDNAELDKTRAKIWGDVLELTPSQLLDVVKTKPGWTDINNAKDGVDLFLFICRVKSVSTSVHLAQARIDATSVWKNFAWDRSVYQTKEKFCSSIETLRAAGCEVPTDSQQADAMMLALSVGPERFRIAHQKLVVDVAEGTKTFPTTFKEAYDWALLNDTKGITKASKESRGDPLLSMKMTEPRRPHQNNRYDYREDQPRHANHGGGAYQPRRDDTGYGGKNNNNHSAKGKPQFQSGKDGSKYNSRDNQGNSGASSNNNKSNKDKKGKDGNSSNKSQGASKSASKSKRPKGRGNKVSAAGVVKSITWGSDDERGGNYYSFTTRVIPSSQGAKPKTYTTAYGSDSEDEDDSKRPSFDLAEAKEPIGRVKQKPLKKPARSNSSRENSSAGDSSDDEMPELREDISEEDDEDAQYGSHIQDIICFSWRIDNPTRKGEVLECGCEHCEQNRLTVAWIISEAGEDMVPDHLKHTSYTTTFESDDEDEDDMDVENYSSDEADDDSGNGSNNDGDDNSDNCWYAGGPYHNAIDSDGDDDDKSMDLGGANADFNRKCCHHTPVVTKGNGDHTTHRAGFGKDNYIHEGVDFDDESVDSLYQEHTSVSKKGRTPYISRSENLTFQLEPQSHIHNNRRFVPAPPPITESESALLTETRCNTRYNTGLHRLAEQPIWQNVDWQGKQPVAVSSLLCEMCDEMPRGPHELGVPCHEQFGNVIPDPVPDSEEEEDGEADDTLDASDIEVAVHQPEPEPEPEEIPHPPTLSYALLQDIITVAIGRQRLRTQRHNSSQHYQASEAWFNRRLARARGINISDSMVCLRHSIPPQNLLQMFTSLVYRNHLAAMREAYPDATYLRSLEGRIFIPLLDPTLLNTFDAVYEDPTTASVAMDAMDADVQTVDDIPFHYEVSDPQQDLLHTNGDQVAHGSLLEHDMQIINPAASTTTTSTSIPTPVLLIGNESDEDNDLEEEEYDPDLERLRDAIHDMMRLGTQPTPKFSNQVFTREGITNVTITSQQYGDEVPTGDPTASVVINGITDMTSPSVHLLVESSTLVVNFDSFNVEVSSPHPVNFVVDLVKRMISLFMKMLYQCRNFISLAAHITMAAADNYLQFRRALRIQQDNWMLDTGSEVHIAIAPDQLGITNLRPADIRVDGIGQHSVRFRQCGDLFDIGRVYIGNAPCNILSAGRAIVHGATLEILPNLSTIVVTTREGVVFRFERRGMIWICRRPRFPAAPEMDLRLKNNNHNDDDDNADGHSSSSNQTPLRSTAMVTRSQSHTTSQSRSSNSGSTSSTKQVAMVTVDEMKLRYNKKQLEEIEKVKAFHESLNFPGKGTLIATLQSGALMDAPNISTAGVHNYFSVYGKPLAEDAGDRTKHKPKQLASLLDESIIEQIRKVILSIDLFFIGKLVFMIGSFLLPFCERPVLVQQFLNNGKKPEAIVHAIRAFVGMLKTYKVEVTMIRCDLEPALVAAKPLIESTLGVKVEQLTQNVPPAERGIRSVKSGMRARVAMLPYRLFGTLIPFLVAWAVSRLNLLMSVTAPTKLTPYQALTGRKANYSHVCAASFGTIIRLDATNAEFPNTLAPRSVEGIALVPTGNQHGDWYCYNLATDRVVTRYIRKSDPVPCSQAVIDLINKKAANWSQELLLSTFNGEVPDEDHDDTDLPSHGRSVDADNDSQVEDSAPEPITDQSASVELNQDVPITDVPLTGVQSTGVDPLIGSKVYKKFPGYGDQHFEGIVTGFKAPWYKIEYDDGDSEEMTAKQIAKYSKVPPRFIAAFTRMGKQYSFHMSLKKGLSKHKHEGTKAIIKELTSIHKTGTLEPIDYGRLTSLQKSKAIRSMLFFKEKYLPSGEFEKLKARLVAGGNMQDKELYTSSQTSSPTVATEVVMMVAAIAAKERRHVITADVTSAFLRGKFDKSAPPVFMRLDKELADVLINIEPSYRKFQRDNGSIYFRLKRPLYGLVEAAKLWYDEITRTLIEEGFEQNPYDACTFNRMYRGKQHTVILHVDDMLCTCEDPRANRQIVKALEAKYDKIGIQEGLVHSYLGMTWDFSESGKVKVTQDGYVSELLASEDIRTAVKTPATVGLFDIDESSLELNKTERENFHSVVAKLLYLSKRTRPDILVAVNFLTSRVLISTKEDLEKLIRVLKYLYGTQKWGIVLETDDLMMVLKIFIDASYGVHADGKSHTGLVLMMWRSVIICKSVKQKINTKSSTEAELVALSDSISMAIWCRNFLECQGYDMPPARVFQDNQSTIAMVRAGKPTSDRTRHVSIRFFWVADREKAGEIAIEYLPTKEMLADILTKPLQGELFLKLRKELLNWEED